MHRFIKVINQTIFPPVVSSVLYIAIFHFVIGKEASIGGFDYLQFLVPGLIMMAIINSAWANSSSSLFISKWTKHIEAVLTMPLSYTELALGYVLGSMGRGFVTGTCVFIATYFFAPTPIHSPLAMIAFYIIATFMFGSLGILVALWAEHFEHLGIFNTFFLTPLTMLGGVFYSITVLPELFQRLSLFNPIFYIIDGFRFGMLGISDTSVWMSLSISTVFAVSSFILVVFLMRKGWKVKK